MEHDSDSEPSDIVEHEGFTYEKMWTGDTGAACDWFLWKCVERGCSGQIATAAIRTNRWKRFAVHRDVTGNGLTAFVLRRPHNHAHGKETSRQIGTTAAIGESTSTLTTAPTTSSTDALAAPNYKVFNEIEACHLFKTKTKSKFSISDIQKIYSISFNNGSKRMKKDEHTVTTLNDGIKMSNVNNTIEFQAVKPVSFIDHQTISEKRHLKDLNITVKDTNIIKNIKEKSVIKHGNSSMSTQNKNEDVLCHICGTFFNEYYYNQHVQTTGHLNACEEYFKDRIDFENYRIFSCSVCINTTEFFDTIKHDFTILVDHILLEHIALVVDVYFFALYHENSLNVENKNIAEVKHFEVYNKELTKNTDVYELYKDIVNSFMFQSDALITSESSWTLEETLYVEITIVKKLFENKVASESLVEISHNNEISDSHINTDNFQKTEPLQLIRCKQCNIYVVQQNYENHLQTTAHKISLCYFKNDKIQVNGVQCDNRFLSCRILSPKHISIDHFFQSIESNMLELIARIIKFQNNESVSVNIKMFGLYNHNNSISISDGDVKSFVMSNEILSEVTILLLWFQGISNTFKSHHQQYLKSMPQSYYLARVMFLDLDFYEMTNT